MLKKVGKVLMMLFFLSLREIKRIPFDLRDRCYDVTVKNLPVLAAALKPKPHAHTFTRILTK